MKRKRRRKKLKRFSKKKGLKKIADIENPHENRKPGNSESEEQLSEANQSVSFSIVKKDGSSIPVTASFSLAGTVCAVFLRDIRDIKGYQSLIQQNESLMEKILPKSIALRLKDIITSHLPVCIADNHERVTILFADMVKFTNWSSTMEPAELVSILNGIVCTWDSIASRRGVEKIKTIGDCYMAVCGCPDINENQAQVMVSFAEEMVQALRAYNEQRKTKIEIRVGIHTGPVVAGVIGLSKIMYDIWGPQVSIAAKMESSGVPMAIHVSEITYSYCAGDFPFVPHEDVLLKNGEKMKTYVFSPKKEKYEPVNFNSHPTLDKAITKHKSIRSASSRPSSSNSSNKND